jgi:hypothetical protein
MDTSKIVSFPINEGFVKINRIIYYFINHNLCLLDEKTTTTFNNFSFILSNW